MFAQLGTIQFNLITYFSFIEETKKSGYSLVNRISGKPKLHLSSDDLDRLTIKLQFSSDFCDPQTELDKLEKVKKAKEALSFIYGNGIYKGNYVIESSKLGTKQTNSTGTILSIEIELQLIEHIDDEPIKTRILKKKREAKATTDNIKTKNSDTDEYQEAVNKYLSQTDEERTNEIIAQIATRKSTDDYVEALKVPVVIEAAD